ncbi:MAG: MotA/TolQ/ExbB proton channel family protein [Prevotella sp.]|jgi:motA/tolQ/exbB proton channel family protein|uniref:MotA/TolQ/ExbB proton channel family protein n=1 Tax=Alloprevotella sp. TaxID=1872471 RepID=UPI0015AC7D02|nr:MotA/TolQ/ExbB proton channel family protein [Prevotella sp.]MBD9034987.1 MotA/TolQ/ExbB proton channel family protein [Prevotella sp.]MEE0446748.1 MotA/TolQ/ExbB proton channel family protein [Prevotellamassilia sp.]
MATTNATAPKGAPKKQSQGFTGIKSGFTVIILCCIIAVCIYLFVFGSASNFKGDIGAAFVCMSDAEAFEPAGLIGTVYMGGFVVPIIWTLLFSVIAFSIERYFAIRNAYGRSSLTKFVADIKAALQANDLVKAQAICDKQRGSVANVVGATLKKYKEMEGNTVLTKEQKILAIQKELEEATALEMPMMQENLPIIGSIVTLGTLTGLFGTVLGMIKSFSAMSAGDGGTDSSALAVGISEALVNTASGILTGALAVISYNYYTNKIDRLTFSLDEVGFSIVQTFSATH